MNDLYYAGTILCETEPVGEKLAIVKTSGGYLTAGDIVEFTKNGKKIYGKVICTSLIKKGSEDEITLNAIGGVHEAVAIYKESWTRKEETEAEADGN